MYLLAPHVTYNAEMTPTQSIVLVFLLGVIILGVVGFSNSATVHDTAHDMRHAMGFACH